MDKFRTVMGLFVGILIGVTGGISFKSMPVGIIEGTCFSVLFITIFNKYPKRK